MKKYLYILLIANILFVVSCKDYDRLPFNDDIAPAQVTNIQSESLPGGAKITYSIPDDENLLYVKAVYTLADGSVQETKSSFYKNYLLLEGFADTIEYTANVYSVSRGEKMSEPVQVTFKPLTSPIQLAFKTLEVKKTFGGVSVAFENPYEANLRFTVLTKDSLGEIVPADAYYTKRKDGRFAVRGYEPKETWFGVSISDRWNNRTDTLSGLYTPIFEQQLDKSLFKELKLPGDTHEGHISSALANLWNDLYGPNQRTGNHIFHTKPGTGLPQWFTFDMGVTALLSRIKVHHRYGDAYDGSYTGGDPKIFEIWGSENPDTDGGWENWVLLKTCHSIKPSGSPDGVLTQEDVQFAGVDGEEFEFPEPGGEDEIPPVRYIRIKTLTVWGMLDHMYIAELTLYGEVK
ncbi:MAG: hypothetical protein BWY08_02171 [Bacteroidetes bacterium ADurb.Bin174]|nr:MAG: hypothetical protein BWY08_02171 [Bacteroidetes bacterium ADurb.Bin174]